MINVNTLDSKNIFKSSNDNIPELMFTPVLLSNSADVTGLTSQNKVLYEKITTIFMTIGIPAHLQGYHFLREAIQLAVGNFGIFNGGMKKLYPLIASRYNTNIYIVERSIRNAIEIACNRGKMVNLNTVFGIAVFERNHRPTNSELIALLVEKLYLDCI